MPSFKNKRIVNIILIIFAINATTNLEASIFDFKTIDKANEQYKNKDYKNASKTYKKVLNTPEANYNLANSLYKQEKYKDALEEYAKVTTTKEDFEYKKLHNMGNTYVKLNDLENAKKMYENALKIKNDKQTKENLQAENKFLEKQKKQNKDK